MVILKCNQKEEEEGRTDRQGRHNKPEKAADSEYRAYYTSIRHFLIKYDPD